MEKKLEICVDSMASARAAIGGGADRLELCNAICTGGMTPYGGVLRQIRRTSDIPVRCMIRPRAGDFLYDRDELELMVWQIQELKALEPEGFVFGCLTAEGDLDVEAMKRLMDAAGDSKVTLHRAIDVSRDPERTYSEAAELGVDTVLTSGGARTALLGHETIGRMLDLQAAMGGPQVLIAAGVDAETITELRSRLMGAEQFHLSGKRFAESGMMFRRADVPMGLERMDEWHRYQTDIKKVKAARDALDR